MRAALLLTLLGAASLAGEASGSWKVNPALSTHVDNQKSVTVRIEPHLRGEVFTVDTVAVDGRASTSSTILYFDGKPRDFQDPGCAGTQSSRRVDYRTVEIVRECTGQQVRLIRRAEKPGVLILEINQRNSDGLRSERRLVMEKQ